MRDGRYDDAIVRVDDRDAPRDRLRVAQREKRSRRWRRARVEVFLNKIHHVIFLRLGETYSVLFYIIKHVNNTER